MLASALQWLPCTVVLRIMGHPASHMWGGGAQILCWFYATPCKTSAMGVPGKTSTMGVPLKTSVIRFPRITRRRSSAVRTEQPPIDESCSEDPKQTNKHIFLKKNKGKGELGGAEIR